MERRPPRSPNGRNAPPPKGPKTGLESGFRKRGDGNFQTRDGKEGFRVGDGNSDRPNRSFGDRPDRGGPEKSKKSFGDRPNRGGNSDRPARSFGDRPDRGGYEDRPKRSFGDRPDRGGNSDRPARSFGDRPDRGGYEDRPKRSFGDRPDRGGFGDRPKRSFGDRPDRGGYEDRPKRSFGDRPARGGYEDRPKRSFGDRPDRGADRGADRGEKRNYGPRINVSLYGIHAVQAALINPDRKIKAIYATEDNVSALAPALEEALENGLVLPDITIVEKEQLHKALPREAVHQGVGLDVEDLEEVFIQDIIRKATVKNKSTVVILDQLTDPHNIGAILRSACAFGADAIIMQNRNAPDMNGLIAKTASGAVEHVPVVYETNLSRAIEALKEAGFFALALDERGQDIAQTPAYEKTVLVLGAEGPGLRPLIKEKCDLLVKLPTPGPISSLNVSNAAAVSLFAIATKA